MPLMRMAINVGDDDLMDEDWVPKETKKNYGKRERVFIDQLF